MLLRDFQKISYISKVFTTFSGNLLHFQAAQYIFGQLSTLSGNLQYFLTTYTIFRHFTRFSDILQDFQTFYNYIIDNLHDLQRIYKIFIQFNLIRFLDYLLHFQTIYYIFKQFTTIYNIFRQLNTFLGNSVPYNISDNLVHFQAINIVRQHWLHFKAIFYIFR